MLEGVWNSKDFVLLRAARQQPTVTQGAWIEIYLDLVLTGELSQKFSKFIFRVICLNPPQYFPFLFLFYLL